jgi:hypothetical protein
MKKRLAKSKPMKKRPMIGAYARNPHEGRRSEILSDYLFSGWGTVTPVHDDYGIDLYCTLSDSIGQRAVVRDYYVVQVKSGTDPWIFDHRESVKWLVEYPTPLFLACVDKKAGILRVYHVTPRFFVWAMGESRSRLVLTPETTAEGRFVEWKDGTEFSLSAPIIQVNLADLLDEPKLAKLKEVFASWVRVDRENCDLVRYGLLRFRMPYEYRVNDGPGNSIGEIGLASPPRPEVIYRGILTAAESAECIGGQLERFGDRSGAIRAALFVDYLRTKYSGAFTDSPRWTDVRLPGDLGRIVRLLNEESEGQSESDYRYRGLDELQRSFEDIPLAKRILSRTGPQVG